MTAWRWVGRWVRRLLVAAGLLLVVMGWLATTNLPWRWYGAMAYPGLNAASPPDVIVMMGGGGIPSESGLMRSWKAAEVARIYSNALVVVSMPNDGTETASSGIEHELMLRGVDPTRLLRESNGRNTREQALEVAAMLLTTNRVSVVGLVTSPEHMKRTWHSFSRAGLTQLIAYPSFAEEIKVDMSYDEAELGAPSLGGVVGANDTAKYRFWDNLMVMVRCARETVAWWYYRAMGWL
jgi:uncharacterized SAM-binding protein YcdF (DUF218 family)